MLAARRADVECEMSHRRIHLLEKLQVQLAAIAAVVAVYFLVAPCVGPADPGAPITFVPDGDLGRALVVMAVVWLVSAACAVVTVSARPEGAIVAALFGAAGISLYSPPIRALLWSRQDALRGVFAQLRLEVLLLSVVLVGVVVIVTLVRRGIARLRPGWLWQSPLLVAAKAKKAKSGGSPGKPLKDLVVAAVGPSEVGMVLRVLEWLGLVDRNAPRRPKSRREAVTKSAYFFGLALLISLVLLLLLLRSPQRGQILFALLASFAIAVLIAHQLFPASVSIVAWLLPVAAAVILYTLAVHSSIPSNPQSWMGVPDYARALPIDWLTAGCGGAVLGYWISERLHEARHIESEEESEGA